MDDEVYYSEDFPPEPSDECEVVLDSEGASKALTAATTDLLSWADWCEANYWGQSAEERRQDKEEQIRYDDNVHRVYGSKALHETAEIAAKSLQVIVYNVGVLAECFDGKLSEYADELERLSTDVGWVGLHVDCLKEKQARYKIFKLTTQRIKNNRHPKVWIDEARRSKFSSRHRYERRPIDFTSLDHIGHSGEVLRKSKESIRDEEETRPRLSSQLSRMSVKSTVSTVHHPALHHTMGRKQTKLGTLKRPEMPVAPPPPKPQRAPVKQEEEETPTRRPASLSLPTSDPGRRLSTLPLPADFHLPDPATCSDDDDSLPTPPPPPAGHEAIRDQIRLSLLPPPTLSEEMEGLDMLSTLIESMQSELK